MDVLATESDNGTAQLGIGLVIFIRDVFALCLNCVLVALERNQKSSFLAKPDRYLGPTVAQRIIECGLTKDMARRADLLQVDTS